jgi:hypothetical protein
MTTSPDGETTMPVSMLSPLAKLHMERWHFPSWDLTERLPALTCPVLLLYGSRDAAAVAGAETFMRQLPNANERQLLDIGHDPFEDAGSASLAIESFLPAWSCSGAQVCRSALGIDRRARMYRELRRYRAMGVRLARENAIVRGIASSCNAQEGHRNAVRVEWRVACVTGCCAEGEAFCARASRPFVFAPLSWGDLFGDALNVPFAPG